MNKAQAILSAVINRQIANGGEVIIEQPAAHVYEMDFNNYIDKKHYCMKSYILWQKNHYHYQITTAQTKTGFNLMQDLPNTKFEQAKELFKAFRP